MPDEEKVFLVRKNCEYSVQVLAKDEDEAMEKAAKLPSSSWSEAWSPFEAEEDDVVPEPPRFTSPPGPPPCAPGCICCMGGEMPCCPNKCCSRR